MKMLPKIFYFNVLLFMLVGCASNTNEKSATDSSENSSVIESNEEDTTQKANRTSTSEVVESDTDDANDISSEMDSETKSPENSESSIGDMEDKEILSQYTSEQIEYARVWLQLGPNQDIDDLYVQHISAGTPLNPDDDTSASYPEDVVQLAGSRLVDGSVTYSGNGDGTINVYNVPLRWDGNYPAGEDFYLDIIKNTKLISVQLGENDKIIKLIKLLNVQS